MALVQCHDKPPLGDGRSRRGLKSRSTPEAWRPTLSSSRRPFVVWRRSIEKERCPLWVLFHRFKVREHERGLLFKDRDFKSVLRPGRRFVWDPLRKVRLDVVSVRDV